MASVLVIGGGGHAKVVIATLQAAGHTVAGVLDDDAAKHGRTLLGVPVLGPAAMAAEARQPAVIAVGDNRAASGWRRRTPGSSGSRSSTPAPWSTSPCGWGRGRSCSLAPWFNPTRSWAPTPS